MCLGGGGVGGGGGRGGCDRRRCLMGLYCIPTGVRPHTYHTHTHTYATPTMFRPSSPKILEAFVLVYTYPCPFPNVLYFHYSISEEGLINFYFGRGQSIRE